jgi:uncharacterized protein
MTMETLRVDKTTDDVSGGLELSQGPLLGRVARLDANRVEVELSDPELITRVTVSDLVALPTGADFLIGLVDAVTRSAGRGPGDVSVGETGDTPLVDLRIMPIGTFSPGQRTSAGVFRRGASAYPHVGGSCYLVDGPRLRGFMSTLAGELAPDERLLLGHFASDREALAVADGNHLFQRHVALLGSTGAGKSWAVALMLERASQLSHANLIVFDLHGEYGPLTQGADDAEPIARGLRVAGPADVARASRDLLHLPYWLFERDELMTLVLNPTDPHASDQVLRFTAHAQSLKKISLVDASREAAVTTFTVDSPIPYRLEHLIQGLKQDDTERIPQHPSHRIEPGPYFGRLTGFISRLEARIADPRYGFIFNPPEETLSYEWFTDTAAKLLEAGPGKTGIKIIDLSEVPSAVLPIVVGVLARLVYDVQFWIDPSERTPVCIVCDEAHLYLPAHEDSGPVHRVALRAFEAIAKEGRKYGVSLLVVSQRPTDVSRTILSQCNNFVIMRLTNDYDQAVIERLVPETLSGVTGVLPVLDVGEAVVIGDALLLPSRLKFDPPARKPASATQPYWSLWAERPSSRQAIAAGVEALRNQLRPM